MAYISRDSNNKIIGSYSSAQTPDQEFVDDNNQEYLDFINPPKTYIELRKDRYISDLGSFPDQLEMIYWDKVNGTSTWEDAITQIKNDIPKT